MRHFLFSGMGYYDDGHGFKDKLGQAAAMLVLLGIGWCVLQAWRWLAAHWPF